MKRSTDYVGGGGVREANIFEEIKGKSWKLKLKCKRSWMAGFRIILGSLIEDLWSSLRLKGSWILMMDCF